jgi:hypothetical protein
MTTNSSGGIYRRGEGEPTEMEAFDAPPSEVRVLLRECYFNWSAALPTNGSLAFQGAPRRA